MNYKTLCSFTRHASNGAVILHEFTAGQAGMGVCFACVKIPVQVSFVDFPKVRLHSS